MVQLYIKQKYEKIADKYKVYDEKQEMVYWCQAIPFSLGAKIKIFDSKDKQLYFIKEKVKFSLKRKYEIFDPDNKLVCTIKSTSALRANFEIEMNGQLNNDGEIQKYEVKSKNILSMDFKILNDKLEIGNVEKKIVWWGDSYMLNIYDSFDPSLFVAMVIVIDSFISGNKNSGYGAGI